MASAQIVSATYKRVTAGGLLALTGTALFVYYKRFHEVLARNRAVELDPYIRARKAMEENSSHRLRDRYAAEDYAAAADAVSSSSH